MKNPGLRHRDRPPWCLPIASLARSFPFSRRAQEDIFFVKIQIKKKKKPLYGLNKHSEIPELPVFNFVLKYFLEDF